MTERDKRWAGVRGGMYRVKGDPPGSFRIELAVVGPTGHRVGQTIMVSDEARHHAVVDPVPYVLDEMVRKLDEALHA